MKHVVITGGAGFIGSHIADALLTRGWRVSILDNLSTGRRENVNPAAELHVADIREQSTADLVAALHPDVVIHQAAQIDVRKSVADPAADADINVGGSVRLLQAAAEAKVKRFVFASTGGAIYGEPIGGGPQTEDHPRAPLSPYGCAKLSVEHYMHFFQHVRGLPCVALRYANVYGPRQNAHGEAGVVAIFASRMLAGEEATINGAGDQTRDFVYVDDVVAANVAAANGELTGAYNVGTGIETSVTQLFREMERIIGPTGVRHAPAKEGEQLRSVLDGTRLRALARLREPVLLRDGLEKTIAWFRESAA